LLLPPIILFGEQINCSPGSHAYEYDRLSQQQLSLLFLIQVKLTKDHHLVTTAELESGKFDAMIKESFEPLMCSKHGEALRLYCTEPSCNAPICTVCKTTQGHDGHAAIELTEQVISHP